MPTVARTATLTEMTTPAETATPSLKTRTEGTTPSSTPDCRAATPTDPGTPTPTAATGDDDGAGGVSPVLVGVGGLVVVGAAVLTIREFLR